MPSKGESMTKPDDLIARAKAAIANHKTYVAEQGGIILSGGMMPELVERVESLEAEVARLRSAIMDRLHWVVLDGSHCDCGECVALVADLNGEAQA